VNRKNRMSKGPQVSENRGAKRQSIPPSRFGYLALSLLFFLAGTGSIRAQVPAHAPSSVLEGFATTAASQPVGRAVVRVNGAVLTDRDLLREMFAIFPYARVHNGFPRTMEADIRSGAMQMMVFEELVYQDAKQRDMTIPSAELASAVKEFRQRFHSPQEYQQMLRDEFKGSPKLFQAQVERSLLIDRFLKEQITDKSAVSPAEVKAYYDTHTERFLLPESYSFQSISILPPPNATAPQLHEAHKRALEALRQAQATKSYEEFGALAERISEDDFRVMMGNHKAADISKLPPVVVTALAAMSTGQVSQLIQFDANDYAILRLVSHNPPGTQKFETVQGALHDQLVKEKIEHLRSVLAMRLSKNAKIEKA